MKKIVLILCISILSSFAAQKEQKNNPFLQGDHFPGGYFLLSHSMPHFMGIFMKHGGMHKIKANAEQEKILEAQYDKMTKFIMKTAKQVKALETEVTLAVVYDGKSSKDLSSKIKKIAELQIALTDIKIECLNLFKKTLTKKQYEMMIKLATTSK